MGRCRLRGGLRQSAGAAEAAHLHGAGRAEGAGARSGARGAGAVAMSAGPRVLLLTLSERTSARGNAYLSGWPGKASVAAFPGEPDKHGNETWDLFVSTPEPRPEAGQERDPARRAQARSEQRPQGPDLGDNRVSTSAPAAKPSASPVARGDGWRGSQYRRPTNSAK